MSPPHHASYATVNRLAWAQLAGAGSAASRPYAAEEMAHAGAYLDRDGWIDWDQVTSVLCLGGGGGQQSLLCASLGCRVTVADLSPQQLAIDRDVAARHGLEVETLQADMLDLSLLHGRGYDLVYQPISSCYVPDVRALYAQVRSVLRRDGLYFAEHWNPTHMQLEPGHPWDGGYRLVHRRGAGEPVAWCSTDGTGAPITCWHYIHPLSELLGALGDTGFSIRRFTDQADSDAAELPGSPGHLAAYVPPLLRVLAELDDR